MRNSSLQDQPSHPSREPDWARSQALAQENRRVRLLAALVDGAVAAIRAGRCRDRVEAQTLGRRVRRTALALFPDKGRAFDLIYQPRLDRAAGEVFQLH